MTTSPVNEPVNSGDDMKPDRTHRKRLADWWNLHMSRKSDDWWNWPKPWDEGF